MLATKQLRQLSKIWRTALAPGIVVSVENTSCMQHAPTTSQARHWEWMQFPSRPNLALAAAASNLKYLKPAIQNSQQARMHLCETVHVQTGQLLHKRPHATADGLLCFQAANSKDQNSKKQESGVRCLHASRC